MKINKFLMIVMVLINFVPIQLYADEMISDTQIQAKLINVIKSKNKYGDEQIEIVLEEKKIQTKYVFFPIAGMDVYYKNNYTSSPIMSIKKGQIYNIGKGLYTAPNERGTIQAVFYIGEAPFDFGRIE